MILRTYLRCRGCGNPFIARFAPDSTDGTKFYFPCPDCELPVRGQAKGQDIHTHQMSFDCEVIPGNDAVELRVVTVNPYVPAKYDVDYDEPTKTSSILFSSSSSANDCLSTSMRPGEPKKRSMKAGQ